MSDNNDSKGMKFGSKHLSDKTVMSNEEDISKYENVLIIGDKEFDGCVLQYGAYGIVHPEMLLPGKEENGVSMIMRCKERKLKLDTSNPTSIRLPMQLSPSIRNIKRHTGYALTKVTTLLDIGGSEMMFKDVIEKDKMDNDITYGHAIGIIAKYYADHADKLARYSIEAGEYDIEIDRLIDRTEKNLFSLGINMSMKDHYSMAKSYVMSSQHERLNDALMRLKSRNKLGVSDTLCIMRSLMTFDDSCMDKKNNRIPALIHEDLRKEYEIVIGRYYDDILGVIRRLDLGKSLEYPKRNLK